jgi:hypothetical protein
VLGLGVALTGVPSLLAADPRPIVALDSSLRRLDGVFASFFDVGVETFETWGQFLRSVSVGNFSAKFLLIII